MKKKMIYIMLLSILFVSIVFSGMNIVFIRSALFICSDVHNLYFHFSTQGTVFYISCDYLNIIDTPCFNKDNINTHSKKISLKKHLKTKKDLLKDKIILSRKFSILNNLPKQKIYIINQYHNHINSLFGLINITHSRAYIGCKNKFL